MGGPWPDKCAQWPAGSRRLRPAHKPFRSEKRPGFRQPDAARPLQATRSCRMKPARLGRSEEHTSELPSLMRISYADFCLKQTQKHININTNLLLSKDKNKSTKT